MTRRTLGDISKRLLLQVVDEGKGYHMLYDGSNVCWLAVAVRLGELTDVEAGVLS